MSNEMPIQPQDQINPKSKLHFNTRIPHCESPAPLFHPCLADMAGAKPLSLYRSSRSSWLVLGRLAGAPDMSQVPPDPHCCLRNQLAWSLITQDHYAITSHVSRLDRSRQGSSLSSRLQPYVLIALCPFWLFLPAPLSCTLPLSAYEVVFAATIFPIPL